MKRIDVKNLYKKFIVFDKDFKKVIWLFTKRGYQKEFNVLKGINFSIQNGEVVGIIGKNGAGKSTLLKIIAGIYFPTSGDVEVNGKIASLIELGAGFEPDLTGRENLFLKGQLMGYSKAEIESMLDEIIDFAELGEYIDMPIRTYSSGMKARLGFGLAITVDPEILIIDEVFAVGDKNFKEKSQKITIELFKKGKTILFVSHSEELVREFCTRVIYLKDGHIKYDGDIDTAFALYNEDNARR